MLDKIRRYFDQHLLPDPSAAEGDSKHRLYLAIAALLLEMTEVDGNVRPEERKAVEEAVRGHLELTEDEVVELLELAEAERADSTDYFQFTSLINGAYTPEQKIELVELLWRIAYANEGLHRYEEHLVRRVADLIYVSHRDFIAAKHRAGIGT